LAAQSASATETAIAACATIAAIPAPRTGGGTGRPITALPTRTANATGTARAAIAAEPAIASLASCATGDRSAIGEGVVKIRNPTGDACASRRPLFAIAAKAAVCAIATISAVCAMTSSNSSDASRSI
jgi:hypothetical protein